MRNKRDRFSFRTNFFKRCGVALPVKQKACDFPGCDQPGLYKAPKSRDRLQEYYWFCQEHARLYNANWDYLAGLSSEAIEAHIRHAAVWERPTWPFGSARYGVQGDQGKAARSARASCASNARRSSQEDPFSTQAACDALAVLGLAPPLPFSRIKARYRLLAKQYHPDANPGNAKAEETFKAIQQAFAFLRKAHEAALKKRP